MSGGGILVEGPSATSEYSVTLTNPGPVQANISMIRWSPIEDQPGQYGWPLKIYVYPSPDKPQPSEGAFSAFAQYSTDGGKTWYPKLNDRINAGTPVFDANSDPENNPTIIYLEEPPGSWATLRIRVWAGRANDFTVNSLLSFPPVTIYGRNGGTNPNAYM